MLEEIRQNRIKKLEKIKEAGIDPYPAPAGQIREISEIIENFEKLSEKATEIILAGRIRLIRGHGGATFFDLEDGSAKIQLFAGRDEIGDKAYEFLLEILDVGDFLEAGGNLFLTKKGEKTVLLRNYRILAKSVLPLPEKWHGLSDIEERFRKRYLDLLMNDEVKERFTIRSRIIREIRGFLDKNGFYEVETPILNPIAGGALAEPFLTRHNALESDFFLRIAPELYLKMLLVGGFRKVYEIGRNFRNEGIDHLHNPEFTMLELYESYRDAGYLKEFCEKLIKTAVKRLFEKEEIEYQRENISFLKKFKTISFFDALKRFALMPNAERAERADFSLKARQFGIEVDDGETKEKIADNIFKKVCRPKIIQPTFLTRHPILISPLAKKSPENEKLADRFQLIIGGIEIANGYSELNDPLEQKERFLEQKAIREKGDLEAVEPDWNYVLAMEYGMPPAAGLGMGIDRLTMLLTDTSNIKETILFPTMRPKAAD